MQEEIRKEQDKLRSNATIYDILKIEHKDVKRLFKQIVDAKRFEEYTYSQIKTALQMHMAGEEKVFYPRLENAAETRVLAIKSFEEHDVGKKLLYDIDSSTDIDAKYAKLRVLSNAINMHFKEEEDELFKKAKRVLSDEEERNMARDFMNQKMANMP